MEIFENSKIIFSLNVKINEKGEKGVYPPQKWQTLTKSKIDEKHTHKAILTGEINDLTIIDFDGDEGMALYHEYLELFKDTFIETSTRGFKHAYFKFDDDFKTGKSFLSKKIDILNNGKFCIIGTPDNNNEIQTMDHEFKNILLSNATIKKTEETEETEEFEEYEDATIEEYEDVEKVRDLIKILTEKEADNRECWISVGSCLFNIIEDKREAYSIWDKFSRLSKKYDSDDIKKEWDTFKSNKKTIGTLIRLAKLHKIKYNNWKAEYKKENELDLSTVYEKYNLNEHTIILFNSLYFDLDVADWFVEEYNNEFIYYDNKLYNYNGKYWEEHNDKSTIFNIIGDLYKKIGFIYETTMNNPDIGEDLHETLLCKFKKCQLTLKSTSGCKSACEFIINKITKNNNVFDKHENLLCFTNGTYDLDTGEFRKADPLDYITQNTGYNYEIQNEEQKKTVFDYINKVISCSDKRDILLFGLASGLRGITMEKLFILTGCGRNSKDTLMTYIMKAVLGNYYYLGNTACITNNIKGGPNPELANLKNKRMVVYNEPSAKETIKGSTVKYLTGANEINARGLYSSNTVINICGTSMILANDLPKLDVVDEAIVERIVIILFNSLFREADYFVENEIEIGENDIFLADDTVKDKNFINDLKMPFMAVLLDYFKVFKSNGYKLGPLPESIKIENKKYLIYSDEFTSWLNDGYKKTDDKKKYIKIKDIYENYKSSDLYMNLNKMEKRNNNYSNFREKIIKNPNLRLFYHKNKMIDGKNLKNILTNYKINFDCEDDDE